MKTGVYLGFLSVFLVYKNFLFPYISSKQLYFNVLVEVLLFFWVGLILKYKDWRPKRSWITGGLLFFLSALLISGILGVDFNLSFWSNVERMLGVFQLAHFFAFYLIIITVFRSPEDWKRLFMVSVVAAFLASLYGIGQKFGIVKSPMGSDRIISTIGNAAYVGAYAIFNIFFALILFFKEKNKPLKYFYAAAAFVILLALVFSGTRGAYIGFAAAVLFMLFLGAVLSKKASLKKAAVAVSVISAVLVGILFLNIHSKFVEESSFLSRLSHISLSDATMQTRLISWRAALEDFHNHPVFGTGYGTFAVTFDKYFDPKFYNYTTSETYFDRAHNNLIDLGSTAGLLGLLSYLSIFSAALYYLIRARRASKVGLVDFVLLLGLILAYFIQNLVVFDSLVTYIAIMVMLGYINWLRTDQQLPAAAEDSSPKNFYLLLGAGLVLVFLIYQYNIKPMKMLTGTIAGQYAYADGDYSGIFDKYHQALSHNTGLDRDSRTSLIQLVNSHPQVLTGLGREQARQEGDYVIGLARKNVAYDPLSSLAEMQLAQTLNTVSSLYIDDSQKFSYYSSEAEKAVDLSIQASPGRVPIYFVKSQIYLMRGDKEKAIETLKYAISLNPEYSDGYCQLGKVYVYYQDQKDGYDNLGRCIDLGGVGSLSSADFVKQMINYYLAKKDDAKVLKLYERLTSLDGNDAKIWANLAKLYADAGHKDEARKAAIKAAELDPSFKEAADNFIRSLK